MDMGFRYYVVYRSVVYLVCRSSLGEDCRGLIWLHGFTAMFIKLDTDFSFREFCTCRSPFSFFFFFIIVLFRCCLFVVQARRLLMHFLPFYITV